MLVFVQDGTHGDMEQLLGLPRQDLLHDLRKDDWVLCGVGLVFKTAQIE